MIHSFDTIVAKKVGINSAVILNNLYFWIEKNKANETNYYDGYYWTYNSKKAFGELFPYFTTRQIDYAIKKLIDDGYVITGNYNKIAYDRTLWYAITEKGYGLLTGNASNNSVNPISQNCKMDKTELLNGNHEIVKPIPDCKPDCKPDINNNIINNEKNHPNDFTQGGKEQSVESERTNALSANNKKNISESINASFEHLWKLLPSTQYDRKVKVKPKRKKELFEMGIERVEKAINLYLKIQDPKYYYRKDNFFNEIIDNYLDKTEKEFEIPIVPHQKEPSPAYNIDRYFETMEAIEAMDTFI